jgi:transcriptional regulator with XRE-family HTH domain
MKSSEFFKQVRDKLDLSQAEFANLLGVSRNYVSMIEGGREPSDSLKFLVERIAEGSEMSAAGKRGRGGDADVTPRSRLKQARLAAGLTMSELAERTGYQIGYLQALEDGLARISESFVEKVCAALPDLSKEELLSGSDHPPVVGEDSPMFGTVGKKPEIVLPPGVSARYVPMISWAQAGTMKSFSDEAYQYEAYLAFNVTDPKAFSVQIRGDSMAPKYEDGDVVILAPSKLPRNSNLVIARLSEERGGDVMFKIFSQSNDGHRVMLTSYNPAYPPLEYERKDFLWIYPAANVVKNLNP